MNNRWHFPLIVGLIIVTLTIIRFTSPPKEPVIQDVPERTTMEERLQSDKSLLAAWQHQFYQQVEATDVHDGIRLEVKQIIADEKRMAVFYTMESLEEGVQFTVSGVQVTDEKGERLPASYSFGSMDDETTVLVEDLVDVSLSEKTSLPDKVTLSIEVARGNLDGRPASKQPAANTYTVTFPVDKQQFAGKKREYPINQTVTIDGQSITVVKMTVYPTEAIVEFTVDPNNTQEIFGFDHLRLVNDQGEEWLGSGGGMISRQHQHQFLYYLDSPYFSSSRSFTLKADSIRALPKEQLDVVIDVQAKKLVKAPDDAIRLLSFERGEKHAAIEFVTTVDDLASPGIYSDHLSFATIRDNLGNSFDIDQQTVSEMKEKSEASVGMMLEGSFADQKQTSLILHLSDYPKRLQSGFAIPLQPKN